MNISDAELVLMKVLWRTHPLTVGQIVERVQNDTDWHANTIKTMLQRLTKKQVVSRAKDGGQFFYRPAVNEETYLTVASQSFLEKLFDGRMSPLVAHFAQQDKLSKSDVEQIEAILEGLKNND